ncbi:hypothetical protein [uncultured Winogradskyella sp.]|uniref:hypothetical protein n=1 Tax=uncultured Winogradskyella sp. TaxID=395353 RepID=UPI0026027510|nr:hypothetical protein [uncultured Winogradskyella sp.]
MNITEIQRRIQNAKDLDFGNIFNESIELFKKTWVNGLVTILLNMVLAIPIVMIVYIPLLVLGLADTYTSSYDYYGSYNSYSQPDLSPIAAISMFVLYIFLMAAMSALGMGLKAGFYRICKLKDLEQMGKEDYFYFFKKHYLGKTIKLGLAYVGITLIAALLCFLPLIYAFVPLTYMFVVYAFNPDKSVSEIIKLSFDLGNRKWLLTFGLMIVSGFLAGIVGMLMCFVGIYVTMSFTFLPPYLIYRDVVGFDDETDTLQIEENSTF